MIWRDRRTVQVDFNEECQLEPQENIHSPKTIRSTFLRMLTSDQVRTKLVNAYLTINKLRSG